MISREIFARVYTHTSNFIDKLAKKQGYLLYHKKKLKA